MKRYVRSQDNRPQVDLEVIINLEYEFENIAAASYINHPVSMRKKDRLDTERLFILNDIVESMLSVFTSHRFEVLSTRQSKKSYAYYILIDIDPERKYDFPLVKVKFRLADHDNQGIDKDATKQASAVYIKSIFVGEEEYASPMKMMGNLIKMCDELAAGNIDALYRKIS